MQTYQTAANNFAPHSQVCAKMGTIGIKNANPAVLSTEHSENLSEGRHLYNFSDRHVGGFRNTVPPVGICAGVSLGAHLCECPWVYAYIQDVGEEAVEWCVHNARSCVLTLFLSRLLFHQSVLSPHLAPSLLFTICTHSHTHTNILTASTHSRYTRALYVHYETRGSCGSYRNHKHRRRPSVQNRWPQ